MLKNLTRSLSKSTYPTFPSAASANQVSVTRSIKLQNGVQKSNKMAEHAQWGYHEPAVIPEKWSTLYPVANGKRQSPIDIKEKDLEKNADLKTIHLDYVPTDITHLSNNGFSVTFFADGTNSKLTGGGLTGEFKLVQFHFHWGAEDSRGSEHTLNGKQFAAEVHLVHLNTAYPSFSDALSHGDGLCVIGAFLEADDTGAESYDKIAELISNVKYKGDTHKFEGGFDARSLLPQDHSSFASYEGSLTTPPLSECVQWINLIKPVKVSRKNLEVFRSLHACEKGSGKDCIIDNYRPVQHLHDRKLCCLSA